MKKKVKSKTASEIIQIVKDALEGHRFPLETEQALQGAVEEVLTPLSAHGLVCRRELVLDTRNRIDFFVQNKGAGINGVGIELKIQGAATNIFKQVCRYAAFSRVEAVILVTNKSMTLPPEVNGTPLAIVNLGRAWL